MRLQLARERVYPLIGLLAAFVKIEGDLLGLLFEPVFLGDQLFDLIDEFIRERVAWSVSSAIQSLDYGSAWTSAGTC